MTNIQRANYQTHPFHLVDQSPWPILTSLSLLGMAVSGVLYMHGYIPGGWFLTLGFFLTASGMTLWFRDIIAEGTLKSNIYLFIKSISSGGIINKAVSKEEIRKSYESYCKEYPNINQTIYFDELDLHSKNEFGHYIAGLIEGDGHLGLPSIGLSKAKKKENPRIVFTTHINNIGMYSYIQASLGGIGRFQLSVSNTLRYIIGDIEGIKLVISLIHNKMRSPKNIRLNQIILFMNEKYNLTITESLLDNSSLLTNSWLTGFIEADGHFWVKYRLPKEKTETRRSISESVHLIFRLDQRSYDIPTNSSMLPFMEKIGKDLYTAINTYKIIAKTSAPLGRKRKFNTIYSYGNTY